MEANFCLACGHPLETRDIGGEMRRACPVCPFVHWGDYSIGVGALVRRGDGILLVRRAQDPGHGFWTTPGGYVEQEEPIEQAIVREVYEETGVTARVAGITALRDQPRRPHNVYIAFALEYVAGEPRADQVENDCAGFFTAEETLGMNVAHLSRWLMDVALHGRGPGLLHDLSPAYPLPGAGLFRVSRAYGISGIHMKNPEAIRIEDHMLHLGQQGDE